LFGEQRFDALKRECVGLGRHGQRSRAMGDYVNSKQDEVVRRAGWRTKGMLVRACGCGRERCSGAHAGEEDGWWAGMRNAGKGFG